MGVAVMAAYTSLCHDTPASCFSLPPDTVVGVGLLWNIGMYPGFGVVCGDSPFPLVGFTLQKIHPRRQLDRVV